MRRIMAAPTPLHVWCPACHARLVAKNLALPLFVLAGAAGLGIGVALRLLWNSSNTAALVVLGIATLVALEVMFALLVINFGKLTAVQPNAGHTPRGDAG